MELMDYRFKQEKLLLDETIFNDRKEQAVDLDFSLPDYCTDIQKILKCQLYPKINSCNFSEGRLDIEGVTRMTLIYLDPSGSSVRICEHDLPFACSFLLDEMASDIIFYAYTKAEYVNCRAVSSRRLDIHGAFSIYVKVNNKKSEDILVGIEGDGIQERKITSKMSQVSGMGMGQFSINEVLELASDKPEIESIIHTSADVVLTDYEVNTDSVILRGNAIVKMLYMSDLNTGSLESVEYSVPINQVISVQGVTPDSVCDIKLKVIGHEMQVHGGDLAQNSLFDVNVNIITTIVGYEDKEQDMLIDIYSTDYEIEPSYKNIDLPIILGGINENYIGKNIIDLNERVLRILDIWSEVISLNCEKAEEGLLIKGKINLSILGLNENDIPIYQEKTIDFAYSKNINIAFDDLNFNADANIISLGYRLTGENKVEIKTEVKISAVVYARNKCKMISDISLDEDNPKQKDDLPALTIYYADEGEEVWNIARKYCTSVDTIKSQNELQEDVISKRSMLLI
jgi:hypothetical protein